MLWGGRGARYIPQTRRFPEISSYPDPILTGSSSRFQICQLQRARGSSTSGGACQMCAFAGVRRGPTHSRRYCFEAAGSTDETSSFGGDESRREYVGNADAQCPSTAVVIIRNEERGWAGGAPARGLQWA